MWRGKVYILFYTILYKGLEHPQMLVSIGIQDKSTVEQLEGTHFQLCGVLIPHIVQESTVYYNLDFSQKPKK